MREITELLNEIPLDELMGQAEPEAAPIILEQKTVTQAPAEKAAGGARVKTHRAGFFAAAAAALALALGGGMYWGITNNKLNPLSFWSKNGVHSSIENQNRSLMEQAIEKNGGDYTLWGDELVAFAEPVAPENYLSDRIDFQVIGYAYSGSRAYLFTCSQIRYETKDNDNAEEQKYESDIRDAIDNEDWLTAKELIENKPEREDPYYYDYGENYDTLITNKDGEDVRFTGQWASIGVGDYAVGYYPIDMDKVSDKTVYVSITGSDDRDKLTVKLDEYKNSGTFDIDCDIRTVIGADENGLVYAKVKKVSYDKGSAEAELELEKELKEGMYISSYPHFLHTDDGSMFLGNILTPIYKNSSSPFKGSIYTDLNYGQMKITFDYAFTPMDMTKLDRFMVGTATIDASGMGTTAQSIVFDPAIVIQDDMSGYDDFYYTNYEYDYKGDMYILDDAAAGLSDIIAEITTQEKADASAFDYRNPQNDMTFVTYDKDGNMTQSAMTMYLYNRKGETGDYMDLTTTICIDGEYYKVSEKLLEKYKTALANIKKEVNG